jgi:hypothetical protein
VSSITLLSDAPNCGITYDRHYDDCNSFKIQATGENDREKKISLVEFGIFLNIQMKQLMKRQVD